MARDFKFYVKKRGDRLTGSRSRGRLGMALFFAAFLLFGCVALAIILLTLSIPEWRVNHQFVETRCKVLGSRVVQSSGENGATYRPEFQLRYHVAGREYNGWHPHDITGVYTGDRRKSEQIVEQYQVEGDYPCWYDPRNPGTAVLRLGYTWFAWPMLVLPAAFITVGGGGLLFMLFGWGKSAERVAAMRQRLTTRELFETAAAPKRKFPNVPDEADLTDSPGTTLSYRLPTESASWQLAAALVFALFWNGILSIFVTMAVRGHLRGEPDWFMTVFVIPFLVVGVAAIAWSLRQLLIVTGVGPTHVEIDAHPLVPGQVCEILVSQSGRLSIESFRVLLVCDETATFRQGTNTRTMSRRVHEEQVLLREHVEIHQGMPFEVRAALSIPASAMHSFKSEHNRVEWKLLVKAVITRWPDVERAFTVVVYPPQAASEAA